MEIQIIRSRRRTISIQLLDPEHLLVRAPILTSGRRIQAFLAEKQNWIDRQAARMREREEKLAHVRTFTEAELRAMAAELRASLKVRLPDFAARIGVTYGQFAVRRQRTRFGSCSAKGNLNFNCVLARMPEEILDYVVVHELCHRKQMNHSAAFWAEVARILPDYKKRKKWLNENGPLFIRALP